MDNKRLLKFIYERINPYTKDRVNIYSLDYCLDMIFLYLYKEDWIDFDEKQSIYEIILKAYDYLCSADINETFIMLMDWELRETSSDNVRKYYLEDTYISMTSYNISKLENSFCQILLAFDSIKTSNESQNILEAAKEIENYCLSCFELLQYEALEYDENGDYLDEMIWEKVNTPDLFKTKYSQKEIDSKIHSYKASIDYLSNLLDYISPYADYIDISVYKKFIIEKLQKNIEILES